MIEKLKESRKAEREAFKKKTAGMGTNQKNKLFVQRHNEIFDAYGKIPVLPKKKNPT
jgi:hypothetical protein